MYVFIEEWETRKKKEITTTRQIETRIKRQVVLEDGEVIKDSGPFVTTNTTEDIEQQEQTTQEVYISIIICEYCIYLKRFYERGRVGIYTYMTRINRFIYNQGCFYFYNFICYSQKRTIANDDNSLKRRREGSISPSASANLNGNITVTSDKITSDAGGGSIIQKELNETIVKSREEVEELVETEKRQHLGDITDEV